MKKTRTVTHATLGQGQALWCPTTKGYSRLIDDGKLSRVVEVLFDGETEPRSILEKFVRFPKYQSLRESILKPMS